MSHPHARLTHARPEQLLNELSTPLRNEVGLQRCRAFMTNPKFLDSIGMKNIVPPTQFLKRLVAKVGEGARSTARVAACACRHGHGRRKPQAVALALLATRAKHMRICCCRE